MKIVLWDHYNAVMGGIEKLIITLAIDWCEEHELTIVSKSDSTIVKVLEEKKVVFHRVDPESIGQTNEITNEHLLIDFGIYREFVGLRRTNPQFLLWRVFPETKTKGILGRLLTRLSFRLLDRKDSLIFMDDECYSTACSDLNHKFSRVIQQLPILVRDQVTLRSGFGGTINISYIGRGTRIWKVMPVKKLVEDLGAISEESFALHIFTDTNELFERELKDVITSNLTVHYHNGYVMDELSNKLGEISDLHYSMGTACLEGAVLGIPTLIADASNVEFPKDYKYRWLVDDISNYAGVFLDGKVRTTGHSLADVIETIKDPQHASRIGKATREAVNDAFSSAKVASMLTSLNPTARVQDVLKYMPSYWRSGAWLRKAT